MAPSAGVPHSTLSIFFLHKHSTWAPCEQAKRFREICHFFQVCLLQICALTALFQMLKVLLLDIGYVSTLFCLIVPTVLSHKRPCLVCFKSLFYTLNQ